MSDESELEFSQKQKFILPTLQSVLIRSWNEVLIALGEGDMALSWQRVETFYLDVLPPICEQECKEDFEKLKNAYERCATNSASYEDILGSYSNAMKVLREQLRPFMQKVKQSLFDHNYLEKSPMQPLKPSKGRMMVPDP